MRSLISNPSLCGFMCAPREGWPLSLTVKRPLLQFALSAGQTQLLLRQRLPHLEVTSCSLLSAFVGSHGITLTRTLLSPSLTQTLKTWINDSFTTMTNGPSSPLPDALLWV